jgi:ethanolamine utilization protein EutN
MFYGRVVGKIVSTKKVDKLKGLRLLVVQKVNHNGEYQGEPLIAVDYVSAGVGDFVFLSKSKDSAFPLKDRLTPVDAGIVGIIDHIKLKSE